MTDQERDPQPDAVVRFFANTGAAIGLILVAVVNATLSLVVVQLGNQSLFTPAGILLLVGNILTVAGAAALATKRWWGPAYGLLIATVPVCLGLLLLIR
jgi:membrane protein YdbS with pleckstrin-like domain